jgi:hypothetical protein
VLIDGQEHPTVPREPRDHGYELRPAARPSGTGLRIRGNGEIALV